MKWNGMKLPIMMIWNRFLCSCGCFLHIYDIHNTYAKYGWFKSTIRFVYVCVFCRSFILLSAWVKMNFPKPFFFPHLFSICHRWICAHLSYMHIGVSCSGTVNGKKHGKFRHWFENTPIFNQCMGKHFSRCICSRRTFAVIVFLLLLNCSICVISTRR